MPNTNVARFMEHTLEYGRQTWATSVECEQNRDNGNLDGEADYVVSDYKHSLMQARCTIHLALNLLQKSDSE